MPLDALTKRELAEDFLSAGDPQIITALIKAEGKESALTRLYRSATHGGEIQSGIDLNTMIFSIAAASGKPEVWQGLVRAFLDKDFAERTIAAHPSVPDIRKAAERKAAFEKK